MLSPSKKGAEGMDNAGVDGDPVLMEGKVVGTLHIGVGTNMSIKVLMEGCKHSASVHLTVGTSSFLGTDRIKPSTESLCNGGTSSKLSERMRGGVAANAQLE